MFDATFFLTKIMGFYMLIVGVSVLIKGKTLHKMVRDFTSSGFAQYFGGVITLILGLLVVGVHNVWAMPLNVLLITIFGWLTLLKGITFLLLPDDAIKKMIKSFDNKTWYVIAGLFSLIVGIYFVYTWYMVVA